MVTDREFLTAKPQIDASRPPVWSYALASPLDDIRGIADEDMPDEAEEDEDDEDDEDEEAEDFDEEEDYDEEEEENEPE